MYTKPAFVKYMFVILLLLPFFAPGQLPGEKLNLTAVKNDKKERNISGIYILGYGSLETRAFLDILAEKMSTQLRAKEIKCEFVYKGKTKIRIDSSLKQNMPGDFKYFMVFEPQNTQYYDLSNSNYSGTGGGSNGIPAIPYSINSRNMNYVQKFKIQLFDMDDVSGNIWECMLDLDFNMGKKRTYAYIAGILLKSLKENKLIR